ncbi:Persistence and stress-resistance antitoxin PasI [Marinobacterium sp. xm-a-121]|uniref:RnfH family protein n=1 Tax=unclassified Marinobacterium TaxID=2644139 RepID=UPI0015682C93|nr:Persistence and stress-resistance antitoxin PasI [Marinobacterium sp. xm-a-121]NRP53532.1 Persistence and stress-resistance antitoxin PasI [Marinobacterium sp. xm-v-242]NRP77782.1 Persistence and stress-resistance antitoxin PasI [Marinobacterium sp. xm-m-383]NRP99784.1 Persistence and stress-resistance antitoxin PasI [Marinobacterium sp. xm-v-233]NRQ01287.1 Persistence and stress-resistance antitoxin PasI [Marinobacterium sp. xm-d-530]
MINVEVAYALPTEQKIIALQVEEGTTAYDAVVRSRIAELYKQIDINSDTMGIFSRAIKDPKAEVLRDGDRVEIYRPLIADPKEVRARRAAEAKAKKANS